MFSVIIANITRASEGDNNMRPLTWGAQTEKIRKITLKFSLIRSTAFFITAIEWLKKWFLAAQNSS